MLAQFAIVVFAIFAVLALVVDVGSVTLTRVQMQNAADSAAVEGLRGRDLGITPDVDDDAFQADCRRRTAARNNVSWTFDDDFALGADSLQLGAGPNIEFTDAGIGVMNASQLIDTGAASVYKPVLERNQPANAVHGDMVSGTFTYSSEPTPSEDGAYARTDFVPGAPVTPGASGLAGCPADDNFTGVPPSGSVWNPLDSTAFLVRLRRASDRDALARDPGVSSSGNAMQLLFARGTALQGTDPVSGYSLRRDGITVRATAIAQLRPVMRIGPANDSLPERGAVAYAISRECWDGAWDDATAVVTVDSASTPPTIRVAGEPSCPSDAIRVEAGGWSVGDVVPVPDPVATQIPPCAFSGSCLKGFVAIFESIGADDRVIGFGRSALVDPADPLLKAAVTIPLGGSVPARLIRRKSLSRVAGRNASAHLPEGVSGSPAPSLTQAELRQVLTHNQSLQGRLMVPVLVR